MPTVGPQLPPHLAKRKRSSEDDDCPLSPATKTSRAANPNEIGLDDSSEDDVYGPSAPARAAEEEKPSIGPAMPPALANNTDEIDLADSDSDSDTGPAPALGSSIPRPSRPPPSPQKSSIGPTMPPAPAKNTDEIDLSDSDSDTGPAPASGPHIPPKKPKGPSMPPTQPDDLPAPTPKRTYGPSLPGPLSELPTSALSDSDSDSDYGPALPSASRRPAQPLPETASAAAPSKRDDWMLAPPTQTGPRAPDPTKLKSRSFRSGPSAAAAPSSSGVPSIWTETAAEKLARLQNQVLGRGPDDKNTAAGPSKASSSSSNRDDAEQRRRIEAYNEQTRGKSLYEEKKEARKKGAGGRRKEEEEDDPSQRPFDREKDMALGGKLGAAQKREFVGKAANFGDRFSKGSFL